MSKDKEEEVKSCESCGASIYQEHIKKGAADLFAGKLLCPHCLQQKKEIAAVNPAAAYSEGEPAQDDEPLTLLVDEDEGEEGVTASKPPTEIRSFGGGPSGGTSYGAPVPDEDLYRRSLQPESPHATRCRTFHGKLTDASMAHMNQVMNEWVDRNPDIEIKFATSCIGLVVGKSSQDLNIFVTVFY